MTALFCSIGRVFGVCRMASEVESSCVPEVEELSQTTRQIQVQHLVPPADDESFQECADGEQLDRCIITDEMIKEEQEIRNEISKDEMANKRKLSALEKEKSFQHLLALLSRSQLYAKYLKDKMKEQQERSAYKLHQEEQARKKKAEKEQKENVHVKVVSTRSTSGVHQDSSMNEKKRRWTQSQQENRTSSNLKRKKLEDIKINGKLKPGDASDNEEDSFQGSTLPVKVDEEIARQISPRQPELLVGGVMRDYQLEGYEWMKVLFENGINGILADEMGLGKTIQCIALVAHLVGKSIAGPYLIVAPLSTLPNWLSEFKRFTPQIPVILYHGNKETRQELGKKISRQMKFMTDKKLMSTKPVVLTSYDIAIKDAGFLRKHQWRYLIIDEGHRLKNFNSRLFLELKRFTVANRLLLTGTPLQNNLSELWSLLNFLLPEIFDNLKVFESWFDVESMSTGESDETIIVQEKEKHIISTLQEILNPFLLRRVKADVHISLPPKKEIMVFAPLSQTQELFYKSTLDKSISILLKERSGENIDSSDEILGSRRRSCVKDLDYSVFDRDLTKAELDILDKRPEEFSNSNDRVTDEVNECEKRVQVNSDVQLNTRNLMMLLRKICNHPYLVEFPLDKKTGSFKVDEDIVKVCGKLQILDCMLPALKERGHKVLLFSQMTSLLNIIEDYCSLRKFNYVRLDGNVSLNDREEIIRSFNKDPHIFLFLLSTRAGGLGINLTAADTVIIYDSDWNPQCDLQAQDRCHRFGQTKPVLVYRLVTANTIDEKMVSRAGAKRKLEKLIMKRGRFSKSLGTDVPASSTSVFNIEELKELLKSTDHSGVVHTDSDQLLTTKQLDLLLDRSDLVQRDRDTQVRSPCEENGFFKLVDSSVHENVFLTTTEASG